MKKEDFTTRELVLLQAAAAETSQAYLNEAKKAVDGDRAAALEAVAIKRAIIADATANITEQISVSLRQSAAKSDATLSANEADRRPVNACERVAARPQTQAIRDLVRELRKSVVGLSSGRDFYA